MTHPERKQRIRLFISCLVDNFFPQVGEAMLRVLSGMGLEIEFPQEQTCCGQPAFNSGHAKEAEKVACHFLDVFGDGDEAIVCPSGSCVSMVKHYYAELFRNDPEKLSRVEKIASNIYEFSEFVFQRKEALNLNSAYKGRVTFHDSCHALRELGISSQPRELIKSLDGVELVEMEMADACCGFGGTFSIKYPEVSKSMLQEKTDSILDSGADAVVSTDMGCLMNIKGLVSRKKMPVKVLHLAELIAFEDTK
ncbi:MAG: (Fe-S)-binding protein [Candidatus Dadabacteria bacterium]|nr:(Fe-S)-binding protein [Candidatus Dadabacteria bacterium]